MVHIVIKQTLYNKTQMLLEQCKLTMEFKSDIDLDNARYDATANKYDTET